MASDDAPPDMPERLGRYDLLLPIGTGGMATVYLARTEVVAGVHRQVAVKLMHPQFRADANEGARVLIEEAKLAARIRHPNVVEIEEAVEGPHGVYLVMEYVEGETLAGLIREAKAAAGRIPLPIAGRILCDALAGLHAAHELTDSSGKLLNVVHRDFTPSNILVGVDGQSRLTDFGVAKAESRVSRTTTGQIKGKVGYMSPEQILGKPLDRRCDVWAAGVVVWECLVGRRLHRADDQVALLLKIVQEEPPRLRSVDAGLPESIERVVAGALTAVDRRCPTAAELSRRLLEAWQASSGVASHADVGEYVTRAMKLRLEKRREQTANVVSLRERLLCVSRSAAAMVQTDTQSSLDVEPAPPAAFEPTGTVPVTADTLVQPRVARGNRYRRAVVASALGVSILGAFVTRAALREPGSVPAAAKHGIDARLASAGPAAAPSERVVDRQRALVVLANAPIASLHIRDRTIAIAEPGERVEVQLAHEEGELPMQLQATSGDGRRATVEVASGADTVELTFAEPTAKPGPVKPARPRSTAVARPGASTAKQPGLAPSPYRKP